MTRSTLPAAHPAEELSMISKPDFAAVRLSASELSTIREVYAEIYPVRPLLNRIGGLEVMTAEEQSMDEVQFYTLCCNRLIWSGQRFCPSCGWECYVRPATPDS